MYECIKSRSYRWKQAYVGKESLSQMTQGVEMVQKCCGAVPTLFVCFLKSYLPVLIMWAYRTLV